VVADREEAEVTKRELEKTFAEQILCQQLWVPMEGVSVLEIFDPAVNKWQGVLHVARKHGIEPEQIVAIGDDVNDVPMIENAGLGVAMGNARPEVLAVAKRVIGTNKDEGLAEFLEELVAQHLVEPEVNVPANSTGD
jgi:hydroxymethylpyrimidine pyrophosphatase-like HAD family hydrolase